MKKIGNFLGKPVWRDQSLERSEFREIRLWRDQSLEFHGWDNTLVWCCIFARGARDF